MELYEELFNIADDLKRTSADLSLGEAKYGLDQLEVGIQKASRAFSGSWLGYHASVYYEGFNPPPPGTHFSLQKGLYDKRPSFNGTKGNWIEFDPEELYKKMKEDAGNPDLSSVSEAAGAAAEKFETYKVDISSVMHIEDPKQRDGVLMSLMAVLKKLEPLTADQFLEHWKPKGSVISQDMIALQQGLMPPPHCQIRAEIQSIRQSFAICLEASKICSKAASHIKRKSGHKVQNDCIKTKVFIGHGHSLAWLELKNFINDRLGLACDEFDRVAVAGVPIQDRLTDMLDAAGLAFVVMTAEDESSDGKRNARLNVIHEVGLFQGRLGLNKAIVLLENTCEEFSNIKGLAHIPFPKDNISACFEKVRHVLEREGFL